MWECPDFFALSGKHVLLYSTAGGVYWETGELTRRNWCFIRINSVCWTMERTTRRRHSLRMAIAFCGDGSRRNARMMSCAPRAGRGAWLCRASCRLRERRAGDAICAWREVLAGEAFEVPAGSSPDRRESAMQAIEIKNVAGEVLWESSEQTFTLKLVDRTGPWFDVSLDLHGGGLLASSSGAKLFATKARIFCAMFRGGDLNPVLEPNV